MGAPFPHHSLWCDSKCSDISQMRLSSPPWLLKSPWPCPALFTCLSYPTHTFLDVLISLNYMFLCPCDTCCHLSLTLSALSSGQSPQVETPAYSIAVTSRWRSCSFQSNNEKERIFYNNIIPDEPNKSSVNAFILNLQCCIFWEQTIEMLLSACSKPMTSEHSQSHLFAFQGWHFNDKR